MGRYIKQVYGRGFPRDKRCCQVGGGQIHFVEKQKRLNFSTEMTKEQIRSRRRNGFGGQVGRKGGKWEEKVKAVT